MNKSDYKSARIEIESAIQEILIKYGLETELGRTRISWNDSEISFSGKFNIIDQSTGKKTISNAMEIQAKRLLAGCGNLPANVMGSEVYIHGLGLSKIVDVKPSRPKYPFIVDCPKGRYKVTSQDVIDGFNRVVA